MPNRKLHDWPTRRHPDTGQWQACINGRWMSRQRAWQLRQVAAGDCRQCGLSRDRAGVLCTICKRKDSDGKYAKYHGGDDVVSATATI